VTRIAVAATTIATRATIATVTSAET
jgi:hypothetical protein